MKVAILTDGVYGDRAYNTIKSKFPCDFITVKYYGDFDEITISENTIEKLKDYDLFITYTLNPDLTYELVRKIKELNNKAFVLVGAWKGEGFKKQIESFGNAFCPYLMCDIDEDELKDYKDYLDNYPHLKEFLKYFGKPKVKLYIKNNKIEKIDVLREAPCGSTSETLKEFVGREFNDKTLIDIGLRVQHFCRAGKIRLFVEKEGKKTKAGKILVSGIQVIQIP
ncbi:TPA: DUF166 domain-containing protein [Methanocaldococcus jannaschii]|uniref:Uncharacterized protein MJ0838 n=2 Tax=Methanocaldococcus jannaschii TaxID=2190 RepID=Y838_METJA|nr:DUF166 domain-containing protein [Methanocaldococcus jannaschii]Q58248.1 RecName: Full=Uncharacterized protein MJ0838 [Methanocaldococcus jannaschii DSM 2661]AAB98843.1 conserved hypothetical protein [Methanocaldococcus jannaschii DSM 2661]HII59007.1 DUF166 domain-containing protein [Methanocaldococcus jannaschii]